MVLRRHLIDSILLPSHTLIKSQINPHDLLLIWETVWIREKIMSTDLSCQLFTQRKSWLYIVSTSSCYKPSARKALTEHSVQVRST